MEASFRVVYKLSSVVVECRHVEFVVKYLFLLLKVKDKFVVLVVSLCLVLIGLIFKRHFGSSGRGDKCLSGAL